MEEELKINKIRFLKYIVLVLTILFLISIFTNGFRGGNSDIGKNNAKEETLNFLNLVLQEKNKAEITDINEESGLYKITIKLDNQVFSAYLSKDGKLFFPSAVDLEKATAQNLENNINLNNSNNLSQ